MKFGQLIEREAKNIFFEKSYTECGKEPSPRPISERLKWSVSVDE